MGNGRKGECLSESFRMKLKPVAMFRRKCLKDC